MHVFELDLPFCANPRCELHVGSGDPGVRGSGNWAQLPDGRVIGRSSYGGVFLCDSCARAEAAQSGRSGQSGGRLTAA